MRIPLSWVNQFSPLPNLNIEDIALFFTRSSCEVEAILACIEPKTIELWSQVQLVEVLHLKKHPNAEKLWLPTIATGPTTNHQIQLVCSANNLYPGLKTLWAPEGTQMHQHTTGENFILKNKEIMGVLSYGMLCSERELSISDEHDGIIDLSEFIAKSANKQSNILGISFAQILSRCLKPNQPLLLNGKTIEAIEFIFDIDNKSLTHRPDMWGIYGIAREFGAVFSSMESKEHGLSNFLSPYNHTWLEQTQQQVKKHNGLSCSTSPITLDIAADSSCQAYCALSMDNIQITESPPWLQQRLLLAGFNIINSVVDISNYVMLELGIPNHIFDRDQLSGNKICVYRLKQNQREFQTLDGQQRQLQAGDTVVADTDKPQVIAGIMGGQDSSVSNNTQRILLEVAVWNAHDIHKSSVRLGLRTDSSLRYEKSLDPYSIEYSLWRLAQLIQQIHPKAQICGHLESYYKKPATPLAIETSVSRIAQVLGYPSLLDGSNNNTGKTTAMTPSEEGNKLVCQIFQNLGFQTEQQSQEGHIKVHLPSYRTSKDISIEEDLIEEIGRIIGYDNIVPQAPMAAIRPVALNSSQQLAREIRNFLVLNGRAQEVLSYPLVGPKLLEQVQWQPSTQPLLLANALNPEQQFLRSSLIPNHLEIVERNARNQRMRQFCIFELGRSYHSSKQGVSEQQHLLISSYSNNTNSILELRNLCGRLLRYLGVPQTIAGPEASQRQHSSWSNTWTNKLQQAVWPQFIPPDWKGLHPYERLYWSVTHNERYTALTEAWLFSIHPTLLHQLKLNGKLAMACIPLGTVLSPKDDKGAAPKRTATQFRPLQRFPSVEFDCTVVIPPQVFAAEAVEALEKGTEHYPRMATLLQQILVRSIYPAPQAKRWLTLQVVFANNNGTLDGEEIKLLEDQTVCILQKAGFPLKMAND